MEGNPLGGLLPLRCRSEGASAFKTASEESQGERWGRAKAGEGKGFGEDMAGCRHGWGSSEELEAL